MKVVGIDVSFHSADYGIALTGGKPVYKKGFPMDRAGMDSLLDDPDVRDADLFLMESTGLYHLPLYHYLLSRVRKAVIMNPVLVRNYKRSLSLRNTKTDRIDAKAIAAFGADCSDRLPQGKTEMDTESLIIARRRAENAQEVAKAKTVLKQDLAVAFPELLSVDVFTGSMLRFLTAYGSAKDVLAASDKDLEAALRPAGKGRKASLGVDELRRLAEGSVGVSLHGFCVRDSARRLLECLDRDRMLTQALTESEESVHPREMEIVTSLPGIGKLEAAQFLAEVGDIRRFPTYEVAN